MNDSRIWVQVDLGRGDREANETWHLQDGEAEMPVTLCGIDFHMLRVVADEFRGLPERPCEVCLAASPLEVE